MNDDYSGTIHIPQGGTLEVEGGDVVMRDHDGNEILRIEGGDE